MTIRQAYDTLGLDGSTTPDQARSRFRDLIRSNHPDGKPWHEQARANETPRVIVEACTLLLTTGFPLELWRECVRNYLVNLVLPALGVRFALGAWPMGWETTWGQRRTFK